MDLLLCTRFITSAKRSAQVTTLIFLLCFFSGIESVTIIPVILNFQYAHKPLPKVRDAYK